MKTSIGITLLSMIICPRCNRDNPRKAVFCNTCGERMDDRYDHRRDNRHDTSYERDQYPTPPPPRHDTSYERDQYPTPPPPPRHDTSYEHDQYPPKGKHKPYRKKCENSGYATASLIISLVGILIGIIAGIIAIILGSIGIAQINKHPHKYKGKGMAITGICIGIAMSIIHTILIFVLLSM